MLGDHEGHELRRGPWYHPLWVFFACLTCKTVGGGHWAYIKDMPEWTEQDYLDNIEWIEGTNA